MVGVGTSPGLRSATEIPPGSEDVAVPVMMRAARSGSRSPGDGPLDAEVTWPVSARFLAPGRVDDTPWRTGRRARGEVRLGAQIVLPSLSPRAVRTGHYLSGPEGPHGDRGRHYDRVGIVTGAGRAAWVPLRDASGGHGRRCSWVADRDEEQLSGTVQRLHLRPDPGRGRAVRAGRADRDEVVRLVPAASELARYARSRMPPGVSPTMCGWRDMLVIDPRRHGAARRGWPAARQPRARHRGSAKRWPRCWPWPMLTVAAGRRARRTRSTSGSIAAIREAVGPEIEDPGMATRGQSGRVHRLWSARGGRTRRLSAQDLLCDPRDHRHPHGASRKGAARPTNDMLVQLSPQIGREGMPRKVAAAGRLPPFLRGGPSLTGVDFPSDGGIAAAIPQRRVHTRLSAGPGRRRAAQSLPGPPVRARIMASWTNEIASCPSVRKIRPFRSCGVARIGAPLLDQGALGKPGRARGTSACG